MSTDPLAPFHPAVQAWFREAFPQPTRAQSLGWPSLVKGDSTLLLAPTGSGKTLTAFLHCLDRLMFTPRPEGRGACRVLYLSPLKALAVDVERNLRAPLAGIARVAQARGDAFTVPDVVIRTGDTPQKERAHFGRHSADLLITTPESLYLLLTSNAREALLGVDTVIIDEIHALVPTKRGAHLALSLERLEALTKRRLQRIGLSATQRPLDEVARYLGGASAGGFRPVTIVDASAPRRLDLHVEVPVEDLARPVVDGPDGKPGRATIWSAIHPRLVELIRAHRTTLLFVNARRSAERLAAALNDEAGEVLVHAHHGSLAKEQRALIEGQLKAGTLRGLVATSSLELGIDMGTIDLVVQIEAPPSVASALQRVGRAGHQVGGTSEGLLFPKYRQDLVACAALAGAMLEGTVESTRYPRNPLDLLAQQVVAMVAVDRWNVDALYDLVRRAAPFTELSRGIFESVLDLLSGHYPSDEFAELKPRVTWDRVAHTLEAREGARRTAIVNGGTIPDRGLYGVFLVGAAPGQARVGELDEEMVFETKPGETFVLGASTWRIEEVTFDKVMVSPAPGEPGKLPFWRGEQVARPLEFGRRIGALVRELRELPARAATDLLVKRNALEPVAARNLLAWLARQAEAGPVPDDRTVVVERTRDELGDWRVCVMSPLGGQVLAPWSMAIAARAKALLGVEVETVWANDGFIVRLPESANAPPVELFVPGADEVEQLVLTQLSATPMFAAKFRENAARALLLPRKRPGQRTPLWQLRKKAQHLLEVASRFPSFPMILETYRECVRDVFDLPALVDTLREVERGTITVRTLDTTTPSPFASSLLFGYVANYLYDGDVPLAERRAQALSVDPTQLRELLGDVELRDLLDVDALAELEATLQHLTEPMRARSMDGVHDLLLRLGDLSREELRLRCASAEVLAMVEGLVAARRVVPLNIAGEPRFVAVEYAARYRDALGLALPEGLPGALLGSAADPLLELISRYARTHGPFALTTPSKRLGVAQAQVEQALGRLTHAGRLVEGAFRPGGTEPEWCDVEVLGSVRRRSLARLRKEVEPVDPAVLGRLVTSWQGVVRRGRGLDALLDAVEKLQGIALPASTLETELLPARLEQYLPGDLDALAAAGEVVWVGVERLGERDGRVALFLTDHVKKLYRPPPLDEASLGERERAIIDVLGRNGASFFAAILAGSGGGFPQATVDALWNLVWRGLVTNDSFYALRAMTTEASLRRAATGPFRSRRASPIAAEGRWTLLSARSSGEQATQTEWATSMAWQLLNRYGVVTREVALAEGVPGGFAGISEVFRAMEEAGRIRRGYFVTGVGAMQFALPAVLDVLRTLRTAPPDDAPEVVTVSAVDPANPYGALLPWPEPPPSRAGKRLVPMRSAGARVVLVDGALAAWVAKNFRQVVAWLPENEPERSRTARAIASQLIVLARRSAARKQGVLVATINGAPAGASPLAPWLEAEGFSASSAGFQFRTRSARSAPRATPDEE